MDASELKALRERVEALETETLRLHYENERLRWRHPVIIPSFNDLSEPMRCDLCRIGEQYADEWSGGDFAVNFYGAIRKRLSEPHGQNARATALLRALEARSLSAEQEQADG